MIVLCTPDQSFELRKFDMFLKRYLFRYAVRYGRTYLPDRGIGDRSLSSELGSELQAVLFCEAPYVVGHFYRVYFSNINYFIVSCVRLKNGELEYTSTGLNICIFLPSLTSLLMNPQFICDVLQV